MEDSRVSSIVHGLVSAFGRGYNVLRKKGGSARREGKRVDKRSSVDGLTASLRYGSRAVGKEYEKGVDRVGQRFGQVDAAASLTLMQTLLKLNAGLVNIVAGLLDRKLRKRADVDLRSLTSLSEACTREAVNTLQDLRYRLTTRPASKSHRAQAPDEHSQQMAKYTHSSKKRHEDKREKRSASTTTKPYWEFQLVHHKPRSGKRRKSTARNRCDRGDSKGDDMVEMPAQRHDSRRKVSVKHASSNEYSPVGLGAIAKENRPRPRVNPSLPPRRLVPRANTARYSLASTKIGEIPMHEWNDSGAISPSPIIDTLDPEPWGWGGPVSSIAGGKASKFGFLNVFKKRVPQRMV
ncbi:hypothetical protein B9Z65_304 [Elsinoe australis]|uniref:Uncharacterized protein n=1 Tax=Elsinoe australis TaxID=40998 RepID=A0A2P7ZQ69_9PEZI|nr:hypothetical protein B9Z65_304 [Elsinoe australis]